MKKGDNMRQNYNSFDDYLKEGELTIPLPEGCVDGEVKVNIVKIVIIMIAIWTDRKEKQC